MAGKSQGFAILSLVFIVTAFCCMWAGSVRCNFLKFDGTDDNGEPFTMELGLWYYAFYTWVVQQSGSGLGLAFYQYNTCNSYESYTPIDPTWKTAQAFAIITFIFGVFTLVVGCISSCITNCFSSENGFATTYGWQAPLCLFTALSQGLILLILASNACNSKVLIGLGGRQTWNATFDETCSLSTGANLCISALVFWFCAAVTSFMAHRFEQEEEGDEGEVADVAAKKAEEGEASTPEQPVAEQPVEAE
mmetsp:Transcript_3986/g.6590  ORF Transcript_3986/g.6590 Transcript_3986/m.6590 type:complete len:249 (+) Transcript_3986:112-858(+)|eukprot:scaffold3356_cov154-Skeletonema_menzelii.AAC.9